MKRHETPTLKVNMTEPVDCPKCNRERIVIGPCSLCFGDRVCSPFKAADWYLDQSRESQHDTDPAPPPEDCE